MSQLKKVNNALYKATLNKGAGILVRVAWFFTNAAFFNHSLAVGSAIKVFILKIFGAKMGTGIVIKPSVNIKFPWKLTVGNNTWIGEKVWIDNVDVITIGDNACISQGAYLLTGNHNYKSESFDLITQPIIIEDGVWIGAKAIVCPGVVCKSHSVLTVASVATTHLNAYGIYKGNPAALAGNRVFN
ncbi:MAG: hypothetical protein RL172_1850 [Bacteroidota bacterium]|jgi:putative colanic acid biosynthesis acetyltransferase WcaF